ncbi:helix-turn-helix domain-containing protein [Methylibium sp.]|uniref:Crp/Fnr family transcriptional regulator n=1 Tax=Methylibium sp. TaxID=2067992 RepID=UPI00286A9893|nr:helix-turn-helix domain-containing protein [Methylibium sp.]
MTPITAATHAAPAAQGHATIERISRTLELLQDRLSLTRRTVHAGDRVYQAGARLGCLYLVHSGFFKTVNFTSDGREQVVGLHFKGDWLGFDGIDEGRHGCDAIAMDVGQVWCIDYAALLEACSAEPSLQAAVHAAMSREIRRDRDSMLSLCTLTADARVADFLRYWADSLAERGLRTDQITLRMTRAEIGNYLGMKLETVSRALSRLARDKVIGFAEKGRRDVSIPDVGALSAFVQRSLGAGSPAAMLQ